MCTRPGPSCHSVRDSARALFFALLTAAHALVFLLVALVVGRFLRRLRPSHARRPSTSIAHIGIQVHLGDPSCIAELENVLWQTLERAARTWAPLPLPVHRIVVAAGLPATGKADVYDDITALDLDQSTAPSVRGSQRLVVISLGLRDGTRDLDAWEVAGALAAQIQGVINDRARERRGAAAPPAALVATGAAPRPGLTAPRNGVSEQPGSAPQAVPIPEPTAPAALVDPDVAASPHGVRELLEVLTRNQPLEAAGSRSTNASEG